MRQRPRGPSEPDTNHILSKVRRILRMRTCPLLIATGIVVSAPSAQAQMVVSDPPALMQKIFQYIMDAKAYTEEAKRWGQTEEQMKEMQSIFSALEFEMALPEGMRMEPVADDYLVEKVCGRGSGSSLLQQGFAALNIGRTADVQKEQRNICVSIQMAQNRKYNDSLEFLEKTIQQAREAERQNLESRNSDNNTSGSVQATQSDSARLGNQLQVLAQEWSTRMQAYDAYIAAMQTRQNVIARAAFKGDSHARAVTDVVKTIALKEALDQWVQE